MAELPAGCAMFAAVHAFDVEALRHELESGVDPNLLEPVEQGRAPFTALNYALVYRSNQPEERIRERLACILVLLEAGASVHYVSMGITPLECVIKNESAAYEPVIAALVDAGADVNASGWGRSVLSIAAEKGTAATVTKLISAGAVDLDRALAKAVSNGKIRNCAPLVRAGAALPVAMNASRIPPPPGYSDTCAYIREIEATGSYRAFEKAHRQLLIFVFLPKFPRLPADMLERIVSLHTTVGVAIPLGGFLGVTNVNC